MGQDRPRSFLAACSLPPDAAVDCYGAFVTYRPEAAVDGWAKILTWYGRHL